MPTEGIPVSLGRGGCQNEHMEVVKVLMNIPEIDIMMSEKKI